MTVSLGNLLDSDVFLFSLLIPAVIEPSSSIDEGVVFASENVIPF